MTKPAPVATTAEPPSSGPVAHRWACVAGHAVETTERPNSTLLRAMYDALLNGCPQCGGVMRHVWPEFVEPEIPARGNAVGV